MMNLNYMKGLALLGLLITLPLTACDDGTGAQFGTVSVQLTDAAGENVTEAWVTVTDIYLQEESGDQDPDGSRHYILQDGDETYELLSLADTVADLVVGETVSTGSYGQLRIVMSGGCIVTDSGTVYASPSYEECGAPDGVLQMPSYAQSGAKVLLNGLQVTGGQQVIVLDFDVEDSFGKMAGGSDKWVMNPVIHGARLELTAGVDATLSAGDVTLPTGFDLGQFSATLLPTEGDSARVSFTDDDDDSVFEASFHYLMPDDGPFDVRLNPPAGLTIGVDPAALVTVDPTSGSTATVGWTLQSATAN